MALNKRTCKKCAVEYDLTPEFFQPHRTGLRHECRTCLNARAKEYRDANRARRNEQAAAYREANRELLAKKARERYAARREQIRESAKWSSLKSEYGLTRAQYEALIESQGGRCALCGRGDVKRLYVDHCHVENRIRGALCPGCNTGLGLLGDNLDGLRAAMAYLSTVPDRINPILPNGPACSGGFRRTSNPESEAA